MKLPFAISLALVLTVGTGCEAVITKAPRDVTLNVSEVPPGFRLTLDQENTAKSLASGFADPVDQEAKLQQNGFSGSWRKEYERDATSGATWIRSGATLFRDANGASFGVTANANQQGLAPATTKVPSAERIGAESFAFEVAEFITGREFTTYTIYFRHANVSNVLAVSGPVGTMDLAIAIDLAKRQLGKAR